MEPRSDPTLFAYTPDSRLESGECNITHFPVGTKLCVKRIPCNGDDQIIVTVKEQLKGLKGNQITLGLMDSKTIGLDIDGIYTGKPCDVVIVLKEN